MASETKYQMFKLLNKEFSFEVDAAQLPCGVNAAMYFVEMDEDGGMKKYPSNKAGAQYGTGYCSAKCPRDLRLINGEANCEGWVPSELNNAAGTGKYGSCCAEVDIWEANSISAALTPHSCDLYGQFRCHGEGCVNGYCDTDGCDFNSYRLGDTGFYGANKTVDTTKKFTVVTQFITDDGTDSGALAEIRRKYIQNGNVINNSITKIPTITPTNGISDSFCSEQKMAFNETNHFGRRGGMKAVGEALARGMVLTFSLLDDYDNHMLWLDGRWPRDADPSKPGVVRGECDASSGDPLYVEGGRPQVTYSKIRVGAIGSTVGGA
ncbi:glycoside hydrolase family 7 protein [Lentithecium fluviatile CBS 122367]|uniref:Glucanase n=1 Tax=Lentithecium fluviatile CBS 122367 TaxID=1168545 RepID=A0A6G1J301_9PLEO|nr:glycoside hydrolase family 7 protein [Lentithecium fluviatile CBS 122367]